jgi:hypothetical protein
MGTDRETIIGLLRDCWDVVPEQEFCDLLRLVTDESVYNLTDQDLEAMLKNFYYQNM